jgi:hypothetical protein
MWVSGLLVTREECLTELSISISALAEQVGIRLLEPAQ